MADEVGGVYMPVMPSVSGFGTKLKRGISSEVSRVGASTGDTYSRGFVSRAGRGIGSRVKGIFGGLAKGAGIAAAAAGAVVGKVLFDSIGEAREAAVVTARTENVIRSMGNAAKISAKDVAAMAGRLSNLSGVDDEAIQSGENLLLTFGNIRNEVGGKFVGTFDQATRLMVDMSRAMGTDMKGSAIQLGKALNDPVKGISALSRVGVSFTQQQKDQIAALTESGDMVSAQNIILGELEKQFGGAAAAMATPADRAKVAWGNFQEELGTAVLPLVDRILTGLADNLPRVMSAGRLLAARLAPAFAEVRDIATEVFDAIREGVVASLPTLRRIGTAVAGVIGSLRDGGGDLAPTFQKIRDVIGEVFTALNAAFGDRETISEFVAYLSDALEAVKSVFKSAVDIITVLWNKFGANVVQMLRSTFSNVLTVVRGVFQVLKGIFDTVAGILTGDWSRAWKGIKDILRGALKVVLGIVRQAFNTLRFAFKNIGVILTSIWRKLWPLLKSLTLKGINGLVAYVKGTPGRFVGALKALPGVVSAVFRGAFSVWRRIVTGAIDALVGAVRSVPGKLGALAGRFAAVGRSLIQSLVSNLTGGAGVVSDISGKVWDAIRGFMNSAIAGIENAISFKVDWPGPGSFSYSPSIPRLETGGRATAGTLAIIGEGREPETVFPDSVLAGFLERMTAAATGGSLNGLRARVIDWDRGLIELIDERIDAREDLTGERTRARRGAAL